MSRSEHVQSLKMDHAVDSLLDETATQLVGQPLSRIEGPLKVCGKATYAAEYHLPDQLYGVLVGATIASGKVRKIHVDAVRQMSGVVDVVVDLKHFVRNAQQGGMKMSPPKGVETIAYYGQPIALVVASTLVEAQAGAWALQVDYERKEGKFDFNEELPNRQWIDWVTDPSEDMGKPEKTLASADVRVDVTYTTPSQSNSPMEPHASLAHWQGDQLIVYTANQMLDSSRTQLADALDMSKEKIQLISPYIGGGFGSKLGIAPEIVAASIAARQLQRPVKVVMSRPQVMEATVRRTNTRQRVGLGADQDGRLHTVIHNSVCTNLPGELFYEPVAVATHFLYRGENRQVKYEMVRMNQGLAGSMRAPGEAVGQLALECAMDELAHKLNLCPIELRKLNEPPKDPSKGVPHSARHLVECLEEGATRFGWDKRAMTPAQQRDGDWLIGYGVAAAARSNELKPSQARVSLRRANLPLGVQAIVETDMTDIGTGTYTILAQITGDLLGLPMDHIDVRLGDTSFPPAAGSGGSWGAASSGSSVYLACEALREQLAKQVGLYADNIQLKDGCITQSGAHDATLAESVKEAVVEKGQQLLGRLASKVGLEQPAQPAEFDPQQTLRVADVLNQMPGSELVALGKIEPGKTKQEYRHAGYGAQFAEVGVHRVTGEIRVRRMLGVFAAGRILNEKTARSQCYGGMVFGIGSALMEEIRYDQRDGRLCNHDLAEYHVPVNADVPALEVVFMPERDPYANPLHAKGVGELALAGAGAAIANAVFNATGIRVYEYPITLDKLLDQLPAV